MITLCKKILVYLEDEAIPFRYSIFSFFFCVTLRNLMECYTSHSPIDFWGMTHLYASYSVLALTLGIVVYWGTKTPIQKIFRVLLPCHILLWIAPILDLILSKGKGFDMAYMIPGLHHNLLMRYFTFFGPLEPMAVTPGIRIEIALILGLCALYFFIKTKRWIKTVFMTISVYTVIYLYSLLLFGIDMLSKLTGVYFFATDFMIAQLYLVMGIILGLICVILSDSPFKKVLKEICIYRNLHYQLMIVLGAVLALKITPHFQPNTPQLFALMTIPISLFFAGIYVMIINNLLDIKGDQISNQTRVLASHQMSESKYAAYQWPVLIIALGYAFSAGVIPLYLMLTLIGNYYLYSVPPLRLKRVTFFSKLVITVNSLLMVLMGYYLIHQSFSGFPIAIAILFFGFTFPINFIDLKDYDGDKACGIRSVPVVLGLKKAKHLIGLSFVGIYPLSGIILLQNRLLSVLAIGIGLFHYAMILKEPYRERNVFIPYLAAVIFVIVYIYIT